jgi:hypothetical protein
MFRWMNSSITKQFLAIVFAITPALYAVASDPTIVGKCARSDALIETAPLDQSISLRIDSELKLLALAGTSQTRVSLPVARRVASEIQTLPNSQLRGLLNDSLSKIYVRLSRDEALDWLTSLPSREKEHTAWDYKAQVYSDAVKVSQDDPDFQKELVAVGLRTGAYQISQVAPLLQRYRRQAPLDATILFRQVIAAFPKATPTDGDIRFLLQITHIMQDSSRDDSIAAAKVMLDALNNPDLQASAQGVPAILLRIQGARDLNASLRNQVEAMAALLHMQDTSVGGRSFAPQAVSLQNSQSISDPSSVNLPSKVQSAEFKSATKALNAPISDDDMLRLANSIHDRGEREQFVLLVVRKVQGKPASITHMAPEILSAISQSDDPNISLSIPRIIFYAAARANDPSTAQLALQSFARGAATTCAEPLKDGEAAFHRAYDCMNEYEWVATDIAKSSIKGSLQIPDSSLLQRLKIHDTLSCDASVHTDDPAK